MFDHLCLRNICDVQITRAQQNGFRVANGEKELGGKVVPAPLRDGFAAQPHRPRRSRGGARAVPLLEPNNGFDLLEIEHGTERCTSRRILPHPIRSREPVVR